MEKSLLKSVMMDLQKEFIAIDVNERNIVLEDYICYCLVGVRRSGKSYLLYQKMQELIDHGLDKKRIVYLNFEDERLAEMTYKDFNLIIECYYELTGLKDKPILFLDELQQIDGWERFARRLADQKYIAYITGSNSKMLSYEMSGKLGGRYVLKTVFPYSFKEYLKGNNVQFTQNDFYSTESRAQLRYLYSDYLTYGAFPELLTFKLLGLSEQKRRDYLQNVYTNIYIGDILVRNNINQGMTIKIILKKMAESVMQPISYRKLTNLIKSTGIQIGISTVINYIDYIKESFLIFSLENYQAKLIDKVSEPKYYFIDTGLLNLFINDYHTKDLENIIAIELVRRYGFENVYYYKKDVEVDFLIPSESLAIQVSFSVLNNEETYKREMRSLVKLANYYEHLKCIIITDDEEKVVEESGVEITVMPAIKFLLGLDEL